jgi:hypothetical protein
MTFLAAVASAASAAYDIYKASQGSDAKKTSNAMLNFRRKDAETNMRHQLELAKIARAEDIVVSTAKSIQNNA